MRVWARHQFDEVDVEFVPDEPGDLSFVDAMQGCLESAGLEVSDISAQSPIPTLEGASVLLKRAWTEDAPARWLGAFSRDLQSRGWTGVIRATPLAPRSWSVRLHAPVPSAFVAFDGDLVSAEDGFGSRAVVTPGAADWCEDAVRWVSGFGADLVVGTAGLEQSAGKADVGGHVLRILCVERAAHLSCADEGMRQVGRTTVTRHGQLVYQVYQPYAPLTDQLNRLRSALTADPVRTRLAFALGLTRWTLGWGNVEFQRTGLGDSLARNLRSNSKIWASQVPDVCGMQLLSQEHLYRAHDLSSWRIAEVCPGRYLVEAADVEDWFGPGGVPEPVLARARADFGAMIVAADHLG